MANNSENEKLSAKVRRALDDLAEIRQSLLSMAEPGVEVQASGQCMDLELAGELKSVVDGLRRLLWAYIEALSAKSGRAPYEVLSWYKMELAVEMLRSLRPQSSAGQPPASDLEQLINSALVIASQYSNNDRPC